MLAKLGIQTVGQFIQLPSDGVIKRFGQKTRELHRFASGELNLPLQPEKPLPPATQRLVLDYPEIALDIDRPTDVEEIEAFTCGHTPYDDVTLVAASWSPES